MKKIKSRRPTPEEAAIFLENIRITHTHVDKPTQMISLRVPANILQAFRTQAKIEGKKYQSVIVDLMRNHLLKK